MNVLVKIDIIEQFICIGKHTPLKYLSLVSCKKNDPSIVIGTISFYPVLVNKIKCLLLGPLAVRLNYQGQGFGKLLVKKGIDLATSQGEKFALYQAIINIIKILDSVN